eukprot:1188032-Prorocentrum_minimum.AAC.1
MLTELSTNGLAAARRCITDDACNPSAENIDRLKSEAYIPFDPDYQCSAGYSGPLCGAPFAFFPKRLSIRSAGRAELAVVSAARTEKA